MTYGARRGGTSHDADDSEAVRPFDLTGMRTGIKQAHLETALALRIYGNFARAGLALDTKPDIVSRRLRDLEFLLATRIFDRHRTGKLIPTRAGKRFLDQSQRILTEFHCLVDSVRQIGEGKAGKIAIGYYGSLAQGALHDLLFKTDPWFHPIHLRPVELPHDAIGIALVNGYIDVAFAIAWGHGDAPPVEVRRRPMWIERIMAVLPEHHPLASRAALTWQDLADEMFLISLRDPVAAIGQLLTENLAPLHHTPKMHVHDVGPANIIHMVAAGQGIGLSLETMLSKQPSGTVHREISGDAGAQAVTVFACWREDNPNPALERFLKRLLIRFPTMIAAVR